MAVGALLISGVRAETTVQGAVHPVENVVVGKGRRRCDAERRLFGKACARGAPGERRGGAGRGSRGEKGRGQRRCGGALLPVVGECAVRAGAGSPCWFCGCACASVRTR